VTDAGGLSATETFVVGVADVNEAPMLSELSGAEVLEGTADGTVVGAVFATDPDAGDTLTYALTDDADERFAIDPDTGVITVVDGARLDHETSPSHSIGVRVTDAGGLSDTDSFLIAVQLDDTADDIITGGAGDDVLGGGPGRDRMFGLDGNDELDGGDGDDLIEGGNGDDVLIGGNGVDVLDGGNGNDIAFGDSGDDHLIGGVGNDQLYGGLDHDLLEGGSGDDLLQANAGDDMLSGGAGDDRLLGGMGADTLAGGPGDDMLSGGTEADRFVFTTIDEGLDVIEDFQADDILAIGEMLVGYAAGDEAAFVRLVDDGTDTTVQVDPDGAANGTAFSSIVVLDGVTGMTLDDLVNAGQIDFWMS
jgi:Ca2+-binding RTX toxin-like protein